MSNTSTIHIKTDFDCKVYDYGQELGTTKADTYFNVELRKGEHELSFVYMEDENISKTITYEVKDADCDYRLIVEIVEVLFEKAKQYEKTDWKIKLSEEEELKSKAYYLYKKAAEKGYAKAQYKFGWILFFPQSYMFYPGVDIEYDESKAIEWFTKAAEQGDSDAQCTLGYCYEIGRGVKKDLAKAVEWYTKAAKQGNVEAQYNLATCYKCGKGVDKDQTKVAEWYTKAAEQGDAKAQCELGYCYYCGEGVEQDFAKAVEWYAKAAKQGNVEAQYNLATCYKCGKGVDKDQTKVAEWYTKAAEQGDEKAQCELGYCYYCGEGVEQDFAKAVEWYTKAARWNATAQCNLGVCYEYGKGVEKDLAKAAEWYTKAAHKGNATAQCNLGICYESGTGVKKDPEEALRWFTKAAKQGNAEAAYYLGRYYCEEKDDKVQAFHFFQISSDKGYYDANVCLGCCYRNGYGTHIDLNKTIELTSNAAQKGCLRAIRAMQAYYAKGIGVKKDSDKAKFYQNTYDEKRKDVNSKNNRPECPEFSHLLWIEMPDDWDELSDSHVDDNNSANSIKTNQIHYLFFDTETTGIPSDYNAPTHILRNWPRLVQLSWITTDKDCNSLSQNDFIIYPDGFTIPKDAARLHGITTDIAKEKGKPLQEVIDKFMEDFNSATTIVGHNIDFDKKIIGAELIRLGQKDIMDSKESICTMEASTDYCKIPGSYGYKWPKLQELHKKLFGCEFEDAHNSMSDVKATLKCFKEMKKLGWI